MYTLKFNQSVKQLQYFHAIYRCVTYPDIGQTSSLETMSIHVCYYWYASLTNMPRYVQYSITKWATRLSPIILLYSEEHLEKQARYSLIISKL